VTATTREKKNAGTAGKKVGLLLVQGSGEKIVFERIDFHRKVAAIELPSSLPFRAR
jgi:hypothetical protein